MISRRTIFWLLGIPALGYVIKNIGQPEYNFYSWKNIAEELQIDFPIDMTKSDKKLHVFPAENLTRHLSQSLELSTAGIFAPRGMDILRILKKNIRLEYCEENFFSLKSWCVSETEYAIYTLAMESDLYHAG